MTNEYKIYKEKNQIRFVLEDGSSAGASAGGTAAASIAGGAQGNLFGKVIKRSQEESEQIKTRNPGVPALGQKSGGGAHRDRKKEMKQGKEKHKKSYTEGFREPDHEISMAKNELRMIYRSALELFQLIKHYSEMEGLEAWQQSKITKAADYLHAVLKSISGEVADKGVAEGSEEKDPVWNKGTPMPKDYTCHCGLYVHPSRRNPKAIHMSDCPYAKKQDKEQGVAESDISGLTTAAKLVKDFIITAEVDGDTKKFRVRGVSGPNAAQERFLKHHSMAKVLDVKPIDNKLSEEDNEVKKITPEVYRAVRNLLGQLQLRGDLKPDHPKYQEIVNVIVGEIGKLYNRAQKSNLEIGEDASLGNTVYIEGCDWNKVVAWLNNNVGKTTLKNPNWMQGWHGEGWSLFLNPSRYEPGKLTFQVRVDTDLSEEEQEELKSKIEQACKADKVAEEKIKGVDGKACWKGKRYAGKKRKPDGTYKDICVPVKEDEYFESLDQKLNEKMLSKKQNALMRAAAADPAVAKRTGVSQATAREFIKKSHGQKVSKLPLRVKKDK